MMEHLEMHWLEVMETLSILLIYRSLIPLSLVESLMGSSGDQFEYINTAPLL